MNRMIPILTILTITGALAAPISAQQANQNINVLPVIPQQDALDDDWFKLGDGYLQRQVEPTIAVSTRNPDHLLAFFIDYRAVDIPDDKGLGEENQNFALLINAFDFMMAGLISLPDLPFVQAPPMAASEAWVGGSRSYDGGLTWSGFFMPGAPFDLSPASTASPVYGLEASTDPVAVAGPCGYVYTVFMGFTRGEQSRMVVARFQDLNNQEGGDTWEFQGTTVIEIGNNALNGYFLDKPRHRPGRHSYLRGQLRGFQCAHRLYTSYSTFNGHETTATSKQDQFRGLRTIRPELGPDENSTTLQPEPGFVPRRRPSPRDSEDHGWRHHLPCVATLLRSRPVLMVKTKDYGKKFSNPKTSPLLSQWRLTTSRRLDESSRPAVPQNFRSNSFPTAAVTGGRRKHLFVAWQELVDIDSGQRRFRTALRHGIARFVRQVVDGPIER